MLESACVVACAIAPIACPGFTDSHFLRATFGTVAYGFFPSFMDPELAAKLVHSANERVTVDDLEIGTRMLRSVALDMLGSQRNPLRHSATFVLHLT